MTFAWPAALLLLALPAAFLAIRLLGRRTDPAALPALTRRLRAGLPRGFRARFAFLEDLAFALAVAALIVAIARPTIAESREETRILGVDIVLAIDLSLSMAAEDLAPSRLEAVKTTAVRFLDRMQGNRVGLVVFAGRTFTLCPITADLGVVIDVVKRLSFDKIPFDGTAIGDGLASALNKFKDDGAKSRVIVLLTDGENNRGNEPMAVAKIAKDKGVRVHTIGAGTPEGSPIPIVRNGQKTFLRNPDGSLVLPKMDLKTLKAVALLTGGVHFEARDEKMLETVFDTISHLEKSEIRTGRKVRFHDVAEIPLAAGAGLLLASLALGGSGFSVRP